MKPGRFIRPAPHYSTEFGEDLSTSCKTVESAIALAFWMAINEKFDGEDRIDSRAWRALNFLFCERDCELRRPHDSSNKKERRHSVRQPTDRRAGLGWRRAVSFGARLCSYSSRFVTSGMRGAHRAL